MENPFLAIDKKWQQYWSENKVYRTTNDKSRKKFFGLIEFPYPSGEGLHVGHPRSYTAMDVITRKKRMEGYNVLFPMGWDAFGLPTENYAIKHGIHPKIVTKKNVDRFRSQLQMLGFGFDWEREVNTTDEKYVKWTQWIFLKMKEKGLAYKKEMPVNWCLGCQVVLANEEVLTGKCERCNSDVIQKVQSQWMLKITEYAERLINDLDDVDYLPKIKAQQVNWIGKSEGAEIDFKVDTSEKTLRVYTTRPDTIFGATYMVIAPEHSLVQSLQTKITNLSAVTKYIEESKKKSSLERTEGKEKSGVCLEGINAINPLNGKKIPIYISDYVLITYGTGAIMAVPAHDTRDYEFAKKFKLPIIEVIKGGNIETEAFTDTEKGTLVNSGILDGMQVNDAIEKMLSYVEEKKIGTRKTQFKLRDWIFSRQRYWGEPIPLVYNKEEGYVPLPFKELPLTLPEVESFAPGANGESALAKVTSWVNTVSPVTGKPAIRETDTMPQWAGSCWYYLRYIDPHNNDALAAKDLLDYWLPVDWYNGGMEHTTLHLLYSRFWHKFLYDEGVVPCKEPYAKRTSHGMILGSDGGKMSKSRGNVMSPDELVEKYGADVFRTYEMEMGAFEDAIPWSMDMFNGTFKFISRIHKLQEKFDPSTVPNKSIETLMHKTIKKVSDDIEKLKFNTGLAAIRILVNEISNLSSIPKPDFENLLKLLCPFAPHICEELWHAIGNTDSIVLSSWPIYEESKTIDSLIPLAIQVNGKLRDVLEVPVDISEADAFNLALASEKVQKYATPANIIKKIFVKGKMVSLVVKN